MVEAVKYDRYNHTALICGTIANCNRGPNQPMIDLRVFHPMEKAGAAVSTGGIDVDADTVRAIGKMVAAQGEY